MDKMKRFLGTAGIYLIGNVLSKLISFFLLPLYTGKLAPEQFGMYDLVVTIICLSAPVAFFQIWDGMFRFAFEKHEANEKYSVISNSFLVWTSGLAIYSIVFFIIYKVLYFEFAGLIFIYGISVAIQYQYLFLARAFLKNKLFALSGLVNSMISAIINIILISTFNIGIESLYIAPVLGCLAQILIIEKVLHPLKNFRFSEIKIHTVMEIIRFSIPLCIATVLYWLLSGYTKLFISQQLGTHSNGLYAVANRFSSMMALALTVFQYAWNEMAYLMVKDANRVTQYERSVEYIFKIVLFGSGIFMLFIKLIFSYFINNKYGDALEIVPLTLMGVAVNAFAGFLDTIFLAEKQTRWTFKTTMVGAGVNIAALWIFTPVWGLQGAIGALFLAFTVLAFFRLYILGKMFAIKFQWSNLMYFLMLAGAVCVFYAVNNTLLVLLAIIILVVLSVCCLHDIIAPLLGMIYKKRRLI